MALFEKELAKLRGRLEDLAIKRKERREDLGHSLTLAKEDIEKAEGKLEKVTIHIGRREEVRDIQEERSELAKAVDRAKRARRVLLFPKVGKWLEYPGRYDIRGVDTLIKRRLVKGIKGKRNGQRRHGVSKGISVVRK